MADKVDRMGPSRTEMKRTKKWKLTTFSLEHKSEYGNLTAKSQMYKINLAEQRPWTIRLQESFLNS